MFADAYLKESEKSDSFFIRRDIMCPHTAWKKVNDVYVCMRCGLTKTYDGRVLFDRKLPNYKLKKRKAKRRK